jgi:hypothetical protein
MCPVVTQLKRENKLPFEIENVKAKISVFTPVA